MSNIDLIRHLYVGDFLGVPVYQPLEHGFLRERSLQERERLTAHFQTACEVRPGVLILGGGGGEHPAIIFHDIDQCVAKYLEHCLPKESFDADEELKKECAHYYEPWKSLEYCDWPNHAHVYFRRRMDGEYRIYQKIATFEGWLVMALGEFVFQVMPTFSSRIQVWHTRHVAEAYCSFNAVSISYSPYGGNGMRRFKLTDIAKLPGTDSGALAPKVDQEMERRVRDYNAGKKARG